MAASFPYVTFQIFASHADVIAAVSTRDGGVSAPPFHSANMSFSAGDNPDCVRENRRRYLTTLGIAPETIISTNQVHATRIVTVGAADCGRGALSPETAIDECDGLLTATPGVPLTMNFADCTPIFLYDPKKKIAALVHGGWRGTAGNIAGCAVREMEKQFGADPKDILAAIGPAIGPCCFEVGEEVIAEFAKIFSPIELAELAEKKENGRFLFHLPEANRRLLLRAGLAETNIEDCRLCTYCHDDKFFSYRKSGGKTGRHMGVICMKQN